MPGRPVKPAEQGSIHGSDNEAVLDSASDEEMSDEELPGLFDHLPHPGVLFEAPRPDLDDEYNDGNRPAITTLEVVAIMLDWMTTYKCSDKSSEDMWRRLRLFLPASIDTSTFNHAKGLVKKHQAMNVQRIEICVKDCIAFWDCKNIPEAKNYRHSHRTQCPVCGESRYIKSDKDTLLPRKVVFFTPIGGFLRSLYRRVDLAPFLNSKRDGHPLGHTTRSRGWQQKMVDDPLMSEDSRNIALIGTADGVPFFDDKYRGCWPFIFRVANLPDGLSHLTLNSHVSLLSANEYLSRSPTTGQIQRYVRQPKSLHPHLLIIADDLYSAYHVGTRVIDWDCRFGLPERVFICRCKLLFWTGDYPGLALVSGFKHKGKRPCHWCEIVVEQDKSLQRPVFGQYRRYLPLSHSSRLDSWGGAIEERPPPESRSHAKVVREAKANVEYMGFKNAAPHRDSGIKELCPLSYLFGFDMVWDFAPDMMHIVEGVLQGHIVPMLKGERLPQMPRRSNQSADISDKDWKRIKNSWKEDYARSASWTLPKDAQKQLDRRTRNLGGERDWFKTGLAICKRTGSIQADGWLKVAEGAWEYIFHGIFDEVPEKAVGLSGVMSALHDLIYAYSHADFGNDPPDRVTLRSNMIELKNTVVNAMAEFDKSFPQSEKAAMFHIILHVPDFVYRWGSVRNGWCFYGERYVSLSPFV